MVSPNRLPLAAKRSPPPGMVPGASATVARAALPLRKRPKFTPCPSRVAQSFQSIMPRMSLCRAQDRGKPAWPAHSRSPTWPSTLTPLCPSGTLADMLACHLPPAPPTIRAASLTVTGRSLRSECRPPRALAAALRSCRSRPSRHRVRRFAWRGMQGASRNTPRHHPVASENPGWPAVAPPFVTDRVVRGRGRGAETRCCPVHGIARGARVNPAWGTLSSRRGETQTQRWATVCYRVADAMRRPRAVRAFRTPSGMNDPALPSSYTGTRVGGAKAMPSRDSIIDRGE